MECAFCKIVSGEIESYIIYEDDDLISFLDIDPINEGHILIIPKKHYLDVDEMPDDILCKLIILSKKIIKAIKVTYNPEGYSIMQNGGEFNDLGHYHMHIFPRYKNDGFNWTYSDEKYEANELIVNKLKENI
ncbi:MAG: HIT family protein [Sarcina sp.]